MSDAIPLPPRPHIEQYKKLAKELQRACKSTTPGAVRNWAAHWSEIMDRLHGPEIQRERVEESWIKFQKSNERAAQCLLADAQCFLARAHGFASWPKFANHLDALARGDSTVSQFEAAVDAIVNGETAALGQLLNTNPELVRTRSAREHRSTLLHYVSANGVEDFRQKTPGNIVEIARLLLRAGVEVNAESDAYGGGSTALMLTATSGHPEAAGVQIPLMEVLIEKGATIDGVNPCLRNGRGPAAEFLASRGAPIDLEGAAGVGWLDAVKGFFDESGALRPPATRQQMLDGFAWACEYGRTGVVDFLLQRGAGVSTKLRPHGQTGLHWAAFGGHADIVKLLLERGAPIDVKDESFDGTPLDWAHYAGRNSPKRFGNGYSEVVALLEAAG
jgi:ankyrin repeat protein